MESTEVEIITTDISQGCDEEESERNKIYYFHLGDHDYFKKTSPKKVSKRKRTVKITELKAVYNCKSCGYKTMKREVFSTHNCVKATVKCVPCTSCDKYRAPPGNVQCPQCSYFTKNKASLKVHMRIHLNGTPYKCTECNFSGRDLKELITHYTHEKNLQCSCGYSTHVKQQMVAHKRSHTGEKPFSCGVCYYSFSDRAGLHRHLKTHAGSC
ncbi:oocyte zinc finger protein XlCOF19-like [Trichoplusia ni]|uniref:Oocyte zinc finger protein XlCOF19-like n=1 Tax=Trichoplusia ni TaxID=7111 RepID=A0A7E5VBC7_TRINI|nr:oocyte zinc finger protein XlCOF19-like [Trichoplusia ni]